jgi:hypothetical protein
MRSAATEGFTHNPLFPSRPLSWIFRGESEAEVNASALYPLCSPVSCIHWVTIPQLTLLEDEMRRLERVNVGIMLAGQGYGGQDVFAQAAWRWDKRQARAVVRGSQRSKDTYCGVHVTSACELRSSQADSCAWCCGNTYFPVRSAIFTVRAGLYDVPKMDCFEAIT